jgi:hypothetical protein
VPSHGYDKCPWVFGLLFFQSLQKFLLLDWKKLNISIHSSKSILAWVIVSWNRDQVDLLSESLGTFCGLWMSEVILSPSISGSYRQSHFGKPIISSWNIWIASGIASSYPILWSTPAFHNSYSSSSDFFIWICDGHGMQPEMIGHYLAEFSISYKPVKHGRPGIGATHSSRFIPLK